MKEACVRVSGVRLPSLTGTDARRLAELMPSLESRSPVSRAVRDAVAEMEGSSDPVVVMLIGEWGEGKTSVFTTIVAPEAEARGWLVLETRASTVMEYLKAMGGRFELSPSHRLLAAVLAASLEGWGKAPRIFDYSSLRGYIRDVLRMLASVSRRVVVFVDEFEDIVASGDEGLVASIVAGLVGLVNGDVVEVSGKCGNGDCWPGLLHLVLSITPPAYVKLSSFSDFATIAARLKRRVRVIRIPPLSRYESIAFLNALARYSLGVRLEDILESRSLVNSIVEAGQGNMGALVLLFRAIASRSLEKGRKVCGNGAVVRLSSSDVVSIMESTLLAIGGAEIPALSSDILARLMEAWTGHAGVAGVNVELAKGFMRELVARLAVTVEELSRTLGIPVSTVNLLASEANSMVEYTWLGRELGISKLVYRVKVLGYEEAFKLLKHELEGQGVEVNHGSPVNGLVESMVRVVDGFGVALLIPLENVEDYVRDAVPVGMQASDAARIAEALKNVASRLEGPEALALNPKLARLLYGSPELGYLDFIVDKLERLRVNRKAYGSGRDALLVALMSVIASEARIVEEPQPVGEGAARLVVEVPGYRAHARILVYSVGGQVTAGEAERIESLVTGLVLSGWRPHAVVVVAYGGVEEAARERLANLERTLFMKTVVASIPSLTLRLKLAALGVKLLEGSKNLDEALRAAARIHEAGQAGSLGLDPLRLQALLREAAEELSITRRVRKALEEGVDGTPLLLKDPTLGYDVEKPTELAGALRYFLVVPSVKTTPSQALKTAHDYVMRYHVYRHAGEGRGLLSPDIDRREVTTLERYTTLLIANGFLERLNGELRIDVLSPLEKAVLTALEQLGAYNEPVQAGQVWRILVDATSNPGTKRMVLQSLMYRGLIEVQGRRIDPEKSRVRLVRPEEAKQVLEEARQALEDLKSNPILREWGYIASAKARDYRVGSLVDLTRKLEAVVTVAENALRVGNHLMALRLARTVMDLVDYVRTDLLERVEKAARKVQELRASLNDVLESVVNVRTALENVVSRYVAGRRVGVKLDVEEALRRALNAIDRVRGLVFSEQELEKIMSELWSEALTRSAREPGKHTPFYINGLGPSLEFNVKLWLALRELKELKVVDDIAEPRISSRLLRRVEEAEKLLETVRALVERRSELLARVRAGNEGFPHIEVPEEVSLDELSRFVEEWRKTVEAELTELARLVELRERVESLKSRVRSYVETVRELAAKAIELARALRDVDSIEAPKLEEKARDGLELVSKAERLVSVDAGEAVDRLLGELENVENMLATLTGELKSMVTAATERVRVEARRLREEVRALSQLVGARLTVPSGDTPEALKQLKSLLESLALEVRKTKALSEIEVSALLALMEIKAAKGEVLLSEAASYIASRLGVDARNARKLLIALIDKGLVEPRL